jgi:hypothetical protein
VSRFLLLTFLLGTIILLSARAGASLGLFLIPSFLWQIVIFLTACSSVIFYFLFRKAGGSSFTQYYLLTVVSKVCGFGAFMLILIFLDGKGAPGNVVLFMISYCSFTALEVGLLFKKINK